MMGEQGMNDTGRLLLLLHASRREDEWRRAAAWRRLHAVPDAGPLPDAGEQQRRSLVTLRRLILRQT